MSQSFSVTDAAQLSAALATIDGEAATNTAYTVTVAAPIFLDSGTLDLGSEASVAFGGSYALDIAAFAVGGAVTMDLRFTGVVTLDDGSLDNMALVTDGGTPVAGYYSGQIVGTVGDAGDSVVNDGTIAFSGVAGAIALDTGTVQNGWDGTTAALVSGTDYGVQITTAGTVLNAGAITASDPGAGIGVQLGAGTIDNGTAAYSSSTISGGNDGVMVVAAGLIANDGTITGTGAAGVWLGSGTANNGEVGDTTAQIDGDPGVGIAIGIGTVAADNGAGNVGNFGQIMTTGSIGVDLGGGGTVTNGSTADTSAMIAGAFEGVEVGQPGSAFGGTVANYASIVANGDDSIQSVIGVFLENGGLVANVGAASLITAVDWGVVVEGAAGTVQNAGSIVGSGLDGIGVELAAGGTVDNGLATGASAAIQGAYDGVLVEGGAAGAGAAVVNAGTIAGSVGVDFESGAVIATGTVLNDGLIESTAGADGYAIVFGDGDERLVLQAAGSFVGSVLGYEDPNSTTTLEFAAGTSGTFTWAADDSGTVIDSAGSFTFSAFGTMVLDAGASWTLLTSAVGTQTIQFQAAATPTTLSLTAPATAPDAVQANITGFGLDGTIDLLGIANALVTGLSYSGSMLDVLGSGGTLAVLDVTGPYTSNSFAHTADTSGTGTFITTDVMPCFVAGTAIRTRWGEVRVQDLQIGDQVICAGGGTRPVVWIGSRRVDVARHASPEAVAPVRVRRGTFADGLPCRDLWLSPDHAVFVDSMLIPIRQLVNGTTIARVMLDKVTYFHVELDRHDVLFAESLPAESYLDTGNRQSFDNGGGVVTLHPRFERACAAPGWARLTVEADRVEPVWRRLAARAAASGWSPALPVGTSDADIRLAAAGRDLWPAQRDDGRCVFVLPPRTSALRIVSRAAAPADLRPWLDDRRRLGIQVGRIVLHGPDGRTEMPLDHPAIAQGWHAIERAGDRQWRWTDGDAALAVPDATTMIEIRLAGRTDYPDATADASASIRSGHNARS